MPCYQGFQKHAGRLPTVHISHGDDAGEPDSDNDHENMPGFDDFLPLEDDSVDRLTRGDNGTSSPLSPSTCIYIYAC